MPLPIMIDIFGDMNLSMQIFTYLSSIDIFYFTDIYSKYCTSSKRIIQMIYFPLYKQIFLLIKIDINIINKLMNTNIIDTTGLINKLIEFTYNALNYRFQNRLKPKNANCRYIVITEPEIIIRNVLYRIFKQVNVKVDNVSHSIYKLLYDNKMFLLLSRFILDCIVANPLESISSLSNYYGSPQAIIYAISNSYTDLTIRMFKDVLQQQICKISHYDLNICLQISVSTNNLTLFSNIMEYAHQQKLIIETLFLNLSNSNHIFISSIKKDIDKLNIDKLNINTIFNWESTKGRSFDECDVIFDNYLYLSSEMIEYIDNLYLSITNMIENNLDKFQYLNTILHYLNINNIPISRMLRFYCGEYQYVLDELIKTMKNNIFIVIYLLYKYHIDKYESSEFINCFYGSDRIIDLPQCIEYNNPYSTLPFNSKPFTNFLLISKLLYI